MKLVSGVPPEADSDVSKKTADHETNEQGITIVLVLDTDGGSKTSGTSTSTSTSTKPMMCS
jgi:hypothetical protein